MIFSNDAIHEDVVFSNRDLFEQLAFEGECNQWGIQPSVLQQFVEIGRAHV